MYLHLYHGRKSPNEVLDGWGFDGGQYKIESFVCTYLSTLRIEPENGKECIKLKFVEDLLIFDGSFYGDFEIISEPLEGVEIKTFKHE